LGIKRLNRKTSFVASLLATLLCAPAAASPHAVEVKSTLNDQKEVAITIHNDNFALVKELRSILLGSGFNKLAFREASALMHPETGLHRSLDYLENFRHIEQDLDFDLLTPQTMVEKGLFEYHL